MTEASAPANEAVSGRALPTRLAIGLMSGTSMDGIDAAVVRSDGHARIETGAFHTAAYDDQIRADLRAILGIDPRTADVSQAEAIRAMSTRLTCLHAVAVETLLDAAGLTAADVDLIGFHGHTTFHDPSTRATLQIGDGALLARLTGIPVVNDFRTADVDAGGEGAPFAPLYHRALASEVTGRPLAVLNLGGVGNVTWLGEDGNAIISGDTGPANALVDDWVFAATGARYDEGGRLAAGGRVDEAILARLMDNAYFDRPPPKSLDRQDFVHAVDAALYRDDGAGGRVPALSAEFSVADGAATLTAFTAASVARVVPLLPAPPVRWLVTGGGRHNATLMGMLRDRLGVPVEPVEAVGWNGDALEAQAFGHLAVRSRLGLSLSLPTTTGVPHPMTGGRFHPVR